MTLCHNALQRHKEPQCLVAHFYHKGHEGKAENLVKDFSYTSMPEAINWGLEQLPNITVQINHSLTRRLTHFPCIKCPLIKLPIWQNPKRQILDSPLMVICSSWATLQAMWCVSSLWQEERTESLLLVWLHLCGLTEMLILANLRLQVRS